MTTAAPVVAVRLPAARASRMAPASACSVTAWTRAFRLVTSVSPARCGVTDVVPVTAPAVFTATRRIPGVPRRAASYCASSPA